MTVSLTSFSWSMRCVPGNTTVAPFASVISSRQSIAVITLGEVCWRYGRSRCQTKLLLTRGDFTIAL